MASRRGTWLEQVQTPGALFRMKYVPASCIATLKVAKKNQHESQHCTWVYMHVHSKNIHRLPTGCSIEPVSSFDSCELTNDSWAIGRSWIGKKGNWPHLIGVSFSSWNLTDIRYKRTMPFDYKTWRSTTPIQSTQPMLRTLLECRQC
jgi:hypothetical protein